jgi:hypothetical protein
MATLATALDAALRDAGIPIDGVSIGVLSDRSTWLVHFVPSATGPQRTLAAQIVSTFDPADPAVIAAQQSSDATATSRQKDILTTCALVVRRSNVAAWNAMTIPQKKAAALAEADNWRDLRVWIENNI